jgi:hypothetical protein
MEELVPISQLIFILGTNLNFIQKIYLYKYLRKDRHRFLAESGAGKTQLVKSILKKISSGMQEF